ncbi:hypothetical protein [Nonomuraea sp. KM88]|uniref:hypothetical protein n=1 Tax=Nonomuraea sp. KM88 TaxID=3457427 RepID=UPI003FCCF126
MPESFGTAPTEDGAVAFTVAGRFIGDAVVTENLFVQNVNILQRLIELEQKITAASQVQQQISQLTGKLNTLQDQVNTAVSNLTNRISAVEFQVAGLQTTAHTHSG